MSTSPSRKSPAKTYVDYVSGPVKIKDGLYMGDEIAAKDMDFIISNKVTHIINTVVKRVPNLYEKYGVQYLSVNWTEKQQNIFDKKNNAINMIYTFIQQAMEEGECVLVHSMNGKSRAGCVVVAYLMKKYSWGLQKSMQFISTKKNTFKIRETFYTQMQDLEKRMQQLQKLSENWNEANIINEEDLILTNTHKNTKIPNIGKQQSPWKNKKKVSWGQKVIVPPFAKATSQNMAIKSRDFMIPEVEKKIKSILKNDPTAPAKQQSQQSPQLQESLQNIEVVAIKNNQISTRNARNYESVQQYENFSKSQTFDREKAERGEVDRSRDRATLKNHITFNNFVGYQDSRQGNNRYSSVNVKKYSQTKDRKESSRYKNNVQTKSSSRLSPYQNIISSIKSPYDSNFINKVGPESAKLHRKIGNRDRDYLTTKPAYTGYKYNTIDIDNRPHSVNLQESLHGSRRKNENQGKGYTSGMKMYNNINGSAIKDSMLVGNNYGGRSKYAWTNQQENTYTYK